MTFDEAYKTLDEQFNNKNSLIHPFWEVIKEEIRRLREIEVRYYYVHENKGRGKL